MKSIIFFFFIKFIMRKNLIKKKNSYFFFKLIKGHYFIKYKLSISKLLNNYKIKIKN